MKTIKQIRESELQMANKETQIIDESPDDLISNALLALNHLTEITDDLYSVVGSEIKITDEEADAILQSYEILSEIHDKYSEIVSMPSQEYDLDGFDVDVTEEVADLVAMTKKNEDTLEETPDRFGDKKAKLKASYAGFKKKLDSGKYPDSEANFVKMMVRISNQFEKMGGTLAQLKEDINISNSLLDEGSVEKRELHANLQRVNARIKFLQSANHGTAKDKATLGELERLNKERESILVKLKENNSELDEAGPIKRVTFVPGGPMEKDLFSLGFKKIKPGKDSYDSTHKIASLYGIPMRAGKYADIFFVVFDTTDKPYGVVDVEGTTRYQTMGQAIADVKKRAGANKWESVEISETPDRYGETKAKLKASLAHFEQKLKNAKNEKAAEDFRKIIANIKNHHMMKNEDLTEGRSFHTMSDSQLKLWLEMNWTDKKVGSAFRFELSMAAKEAKKRGIEWKMNEDLNEKASRSIVFKNRDVTKLTYNPNVKSLTASFKSIGDVYYFLVQPNEWKALMSAEDPISYFTKKIKGSHKSSPAVKTKSMQSEDTELDESELDEEQKKGTIVTWSTGNATKKRFAIEVLGVDGSDLVKLLDKTGLKLKYDKAGDDGIAVTTEVERDKIIATLEKYYKFVKESSMDTLDLDMIAENFDERKFRRLAMTGLVADGDTAKIILAMKNLNAGKPLTKEQKDLIASTFLSLIGFVTGDSGVFTKIQNKIKSNDNTSADD